MPDHQPSDQRRLSRQNLAEAPEEIRSFLRRMILLGAVIVVLLGFGSVGYALSEDASLGFSLLWALDTIATIGSIGLPADTPGRVVYVALIVFGVGTLFYSLVTVTEFFVAGRLSGLLAERRTQKMIDSLSDHHVICGFGRVGRQVASDLVAARQLFVILDHNPDSREAAEETRAPFLEGPAAEEESLLRAGIDRARALVVCMDDDAQNVFTTLTARELRSDILIIARANREATESKLHRAGADRVISPYKASGAEMARLALHPQIADVVEVGPGYRMEEIEVPAGCAGAGRRIDDVRGSSVIVALRPSTGNMQPMPPGETVLGPGDLVVAMGPAEAMDRLDSELAPAGDGAARSHGG